jgi:hypothetical protein
MAQITIHNISDRPNTPGAPVSVILGGRKLRPGQSVSVDDSVLNTKHRAMQGTRLWFGELPSRFVRTSRAALKLLEAATAAGPTAALTLAEAREYLSEFTVEDMLAMAQACSPPIDLRPGASKEAILSRLSRALFQEGRELDPETFFWLGRWTGSRGGFTPLE